MEQKTSKEFNRKLINVISKLKAPKNQYNKFGEYYYRSCEDILEAVKPLLAEEELTLKISDEVIAVGDGIYIKAIAKITDGNHSAEATAFAREPESKPKMDASQVTGSASSYARKYALNGLFLIDDTKDPDATNTHRNELSKPQKPAPKPAGSFKIKPEDLQRIVDFLKKQGVEDEKIQARMKKITTQEEVNTIITVIEREGAKQ